MAHSLFIQRSRLIFIALVVGTVLTALAYYRKPTWMRALLAQRLPPLYDNFREQEQELPHYKEYATKHIKYFFAPNHPVGMGWGNVMQDYIMMNLLARATNRSFVFDDYVWNSDGSLYSDFNGKPIPSRIPLSAILSGPMVGGEPPPGDNGFRAVSKDFFQSICPYPTVLQVPSINDDRMGRDGNISAADVLDIWVHKINSINDPCLQLGESDNPIFDYWFYGQKTRLLSVWPELSASPIITHWQWSSLIYNAYDNNRHIFDPHAPPPTSEHGYNVTPGCSYYQDIPGLLVLHVRRGDFEGHCKYLCRSNSDWNAFNSFPEFIDQYLLPENDGTLHGDQCLPHCYPSIAQMVQKVSRVRAESKEPLKYVYIMTNGAVSWVDELKAALLSEGEWDQIASSRDLELTWEQKFVGQALDMFIAQRAQVLVGNGWSSLTSNVVMLRMAHGMPPHSNRFW
ncbi:hypothetical protein BV22DRAFT_1130074 [Leucogyrophana mollusca]|uniref:Uncharacterized protein n=1 Tax=Leucogyrophana mollusca TaxID=85980 RepID=A0ACB8BFU7_9AGAM|nr:hypothetical protein BV22DRAFT_1130074 [Leucogyrophana mollusca]